jgi:SSS family solute:Na+ symporter
VAGAQLYLGFAGLDWAIVLVYLLLTLGIGVFAARFVKGIAGYLVAGRSLGTALAVAAMTGSELGLITVMYQAEKGFTGGLAALHIALVAGLAALLVGLTGFVVVPLRRLGVMTIPEFYARRFGPRTRVLGGVLLATGGILNMGLFLKIGSQFVVGVTGLQTGSGELVTVMVVLIAIVLFYTVLGGMVSVVLTEYVQFVVLSLGLLLLVVLAWQRIGWENLVRVVEEHKGMAGFDPAVLGEGGGGFGPSYIAWQAVVGVVSVAIWPTAVMRALAARNETVVRRQFTIAAVSFCVRFLIPCFLGVCAFVFFAQSQAVFTTNAEGVYTGFATAGGEYENLDALPLFVADLLPVGLLGLITAAMLAAFMSTHSSYMLSWAAVLTRDVVGPLCKREPSERSQLRLTRIFILAMGGYVVFWGLYYEPRQDIWEYLTITGAVYFTGAIAVLVGGLYWKRASSTGAVLALLAGFSALAGLTQVREPLETVLGPLSAAKVGLGSVSLALLAMVVGSLVFPDPDQTAAEEEVS